MDRDHLHSETIGIFGGYDQAKGARYHSFTPPLCQTVTFPLESAEAARRIYDHRDPYTDYVYTRRNNPTNDIFKQRMAAMEGGEAGLATSSGMAANCTKPILFNSWDLDGIQAIYDICCAAAGSEEAFQANPFALHYVEPISPLTNPRESLEKLLFSAAHALPVMYVPTPSAGGTAPITLAGAFALSNAENLMGLLLTQLKRKGAPFIYSRHRLSGGRIHFFAGTARHGRRDDRAHQKSAQRHYRFFRAPCFGADSRKRTRGQLP